jgi:hypothetical protein
MDYTALADEINNDPQAMGYDQHLPEDHVSVAELLGQDDPAQTVVYESLSSEKATRIAAEVDAYAPIKADAEDASSSTQSSSLAAMDTLRKQGADFALQLQSMRDMLQALVDNEVLTDSQRSAFISASKRTARREEAVLGKGTTVSAQDVTKALS